MYESGIMSSKWDMCQISAGHLKYFITFFKENIGGLGEPRQERNSWMLKRLRKTFKERRRGEWKTLQQKDAKKEDFKKTCLEKNSHVKEKTKYVLSSEGLFCCCLVILELQK